MPDGLPEDPAGTPGTGWASVRRIAILGAEGTGKTRLAHALAAHLRGQGLSVRVLPDPYGASRGVAGAPPPADVLAAITRKQARRLMAPSGADVVISDTAPLVGAALSHLHFGEAALDAFAMAQQRLFDASLLTGLNPFRPDLRPSRASLQQARERLDTWLREALRRTGVRWQVLYGPDHARLDSALSTIQSIADEDRLALGRCQNDHENWAGHLGCALCGDAASERRLFSALLGPSPPAPPADGGQ